MVLFSSNAQFWLTTTNASKTFQNRNRNLCFPLSLTDYPMLQSPRKEGERVPETRCFSLLYRKALVSEGALPEKLWEVETHPTSQNSQAGFYRHCFGNNENGADRGKVCKDVGWETRHTPVSSLGTQVGLETMGSRTRFPGGILGNSINLFLPHSCHVQIEHSSLPGGDCTGIWS